MPAQGQIIAIIPARGGSKGIPLKNIRAVAGKPLVLWTIEAALQATGVGRVVVSTDSADIAKACEIPGAEIIMRPRELAEDWSPSEDALLHVLRAIDNLDQLEAVAFLQATSPLRDATHIDEAIALFRKSGADSLLSVAPSHLFLWEERDDQAVPMHFDYRNRPRRQEMSNQFRENGAIYVFKPQVLLTGGNRLGGKIVLYHMSEDCSIDIDNETDLLYAEMILKMRMGLL